MVAFSRCEYVLVTLNVWVPLGGISGDLCHISNVLFYRYANHVSISHTSRANYEDECDLPPTMRMPSIFVKLLLVRNV
jgi:hypothetical protein